MTRPAILLFDIDGTLISTGGAGRRALERVFAEAYGSQEVFANFAFCGMTDPAIIREGLQRVGHAYTQARAEALLDRYVTLLEDELRLTREHRLHPGMTDVLAAVKKKAHFAVGLGTGNIVAGARAKLQPLGVYDQFGFGGFGSDHESRPELIAIGAARGAKVLGLPLSECRLVVIGDTPKDIAAAKANGGLALAVATGRFSVAELQQAGADYACENLSDTGAQAYLMGNSPPENESRRTY